MWEISGAEFSQSNIHTADGVSIRFPRVTRIRSDKDWETATNLSRLKVGLPVFVQYHGDVQYAQYVCIHLSTIFVWYSTAMYCMFYHNLCMYVFVQCSV